MCLQLAGLEGRDVRLAVQVHEDPLPLRPADVVVALGVVEPASPRERARARLPI